MPEVEEEVAAEFDNSPQLAHLRFGEHRLLEELEPLLREYVPHHADVPVILDSLRDKLYDGHRNVDLRGVHSAVLNCKACPMMAEPVTPKWNVYDPDILIVTERPIRDVPADATFVHALKDAGFSSKRLAATSITRCTTITDEGRNRPNVDEITRCTKRYLFAEIDALKPKLIMAVGATPFAALIGEGKFSASRGQPLWAGPWQVLAVTTAGSAYHDPRRADDLKTDLSLAHRIVYGPS